MPKNNPTILAVDTCTEACSAALLVDGQIFFESANAPREHSQRLLGMVDLLLSKAKISLRDVDGIAYGRGPGSFTGIRICTSMTQGLALGHDIPVYGVSTLETMAQIAKEQGAKQIICAIDARMNEIYTAQYRIEEEKCITVSDEEVCAPENISISLDNAMEVIGCGTGFSAYPDLAKNFSDFEIQPLAELPSAKPMLAIAIEAWQKELYTPVDDLSPVYLRDTVTWKKLPGRE
ncbi:tRNA (adenosine(37)-N6)-threonylcarbamoyltransferase complex dimerization subunit type 1 TsaB [Parashewanella curva]|uniref:tRNA threonylcarbamoyladenosine biosynthesis protein TsaB n=1 Tax=Parashewanella curva TaxID=2338552 RepID=A0A3L8Q3G7_9GAMM|nr:tRNA (adenosine(37)-N6)-threonylcarbamoyltransferase complex dimerization subunit type 1 TsaB [Parashewanella curva]RLV61232.1 tRNA (adenosine(37)-N6)-threonylcarbamoyltransferase complex dimerization subunit type 1 TsaB [Parashewanella curva]